MIRDEPEDEGDDLAAESGVERDEGEPATSWLDTLPPGAGWQPNGSFVLPLLEPIEVAGKRYEELRFRRMKLGHMRKMPSKPDRLEQLFPVACALTGVLEAILCELDGADALRVLEVVNAFFERAAAAGGVSFAGS